MSRESEVPKKCTNCGFLGVRRYDSLEIAEAETFYREVGTYVNRADGRFALLPTCFAGAANFRKEVAEVLVRGGVERDSAFTQARDPSPGLVMAVISADRSNCPGYTPWKDGMTPKEHRDLLNRQWVVEREDRRDEEMRAREDRRDEAAATRHKAQMDAISGQHWRELIVFGGVIGVATIVAAILEGAVSRGWEPFWWPF